MKNKALLPWVLITSLITACIEIDLSVPGFPAMADYFMADVTDIQWTLNINFIGFCVACLIFGPLSDSYGRRKTIIFGFLMFSIGGFGCVLTDSLPLFYCFRFIV